MKALFFTQHGGLEQLQYGELPTPTAGRGEVLIRARACALNRLDLWVLEGWPSLKLQLPHIGGSDIAGEIAALGAECPGWSVGDRVALTPGFVPQGVHDEWIDRGEECLSALYQIFGETCPGGLSEYIVAPVETLIPIPAGLSYAAAAAPLLVATTAWRMLRGRANLSHTDTVLIVGAAGGVNSFAICLAKDLGARVLVIASSRPKAEFARHLGADEVIDTSETPEWSRAIRELTKKRGVDLVVDNVGQATFQQSLQVLARGGRLVTVGNTSGPMVTFDNRLIFGKQLSILGSTMGTAADTRAAIAYAWDHTPQKFVSAEFPLSAGVEAFRHLRDGEVQGKIIVCP